MSLIKKDNNRKKVGVALGSGATLGLAHVGALAVLEREGIPIDMIAGCSMGAIVGGLYCCGMSTEHMRSIAQSITRKEERKYIDFTVSKTGFLYGRKIENLMYTMTGGRKFSELEIPFSAVTCCLEDNELVRIDTGFVAKAIRCSTAIPGIFKPVTIKGKSYVDGAMLERVPIDSLLEMGADYTIAIDVGYRGEKRDTPKSIHEMMLYAYESMQWQAMKPRMSMADIAIGIDTRGMPRSSFRMAKECIAKGEEYTQLVVDDIKKELIELGIM